MSSVVKSGIDQSSKRCESARYVGTKKVRRCVEDLAEGVCCIANSTFFILPLDYNGNSFQRRGCVTLFMVVDLKHTFFFFNAKNEVTLFKVGELIECIALKKFQTDA